MLHEESLRICRTKVKPYEKSYKESYQTSYEKLHEISVLLAANVLCSLGYIILVKELLLKPGVSPNLDSDHSMQLYSHGEHCKLSGVSGGTPAAVNDFDALRLNTKEYCFALFRLIYFITIVFIYLVKIFRLQKDLHENKYEVKKEV